MNRLRLQFVLVGLVVMMMMGEGIYCASSDPVTNFAYETFTAPLHGMNSAKDGDLVLVDTGGLNPAGSVFYQAPVQVHGFRVSFTYSITNRSDIYGHQRPDGIAFVFKNGGSIDVVGPGSGGLGYGSLNEGGGGLSNTVAIEIDSYHNPELNDPENSHVSIHSNGGGLNNANEDYRIGSAPNLYELNPLFNFGTQNVEVEYNPILKGGTFSVTINDQIAFTFANISLDDYLSIDPTMGSSFIGITAASHMGSNATVETISVTRWDYNYLGYLDAANSEVEGIDTVVAGAGLSFIVQAHDQYGLVMSTNTTSSPSSVLHATLVEPNGNEYNATASYIGSGKYGFYINATISGNATVSVWFDNTPVGYGSYVLVVTPANPYPLNSYPFGFTSGVDSVAVAGVPGTFYVRLQDVYGNNITTDVSDVVSATVTPIFETSYSLEIVAEYDPSLGYYKADYNVTLEGNFTIAIFYGKDALKDNQRMIQVVPNEIYNTTSVLYNVPTTAVAGELQTALLQLKDVYGNNASNAIANFTVEITQGSTVVSGAVGNCVRGLCQVTYNLTVASYNEDQYTLVVLVNDNAVLNSSTTLGVIPAALTPSVSYAYGDGISKGRAGDYASFYVQLTDVFGNNFTSPAPPVTAVLASDSGDSIVPTQVYASLGLYTFQYNATKATTYSLTILVNDTAIANGVPSVTISPTDIDAATSIAFGVGVLSDSLVVGVNNVFYVQLRDIYSNNITQQGGEVKAKIENDALSVYATSSFDEQQGVYVLSYNITLAATYTVTITLVDAPIMNSVLSITLQPGDIYPLQCQAFGVDPGVVAGELNQIYIQLRDVYANDITSVPDPNNIASALFVGSNTNTSVAVDYSGTGQYVLSYNATLSGHYNLTIWVLGSTINGGGFYFVEVIPAAAYPPLCIVEGNNVAATVAGTLSLFQVYLFDVFNNSIAQPAPSDAPIVTIDQQVVSLNFNAAINAYDASFNITQSGAFGVTVSINGTQIFSSAIQVATAPLDVANSNTSDPITVPAGANAGFYIYQRDRFDNLIQDYSQVQSIYVLLELGGNQIKMTPQQTTLGAYELNFNITVSGPYSTSVFINDQLVYGNTFTTDITPGPYDPAGTITVGLKTNVTAGDVNVFNIQLKDIFGNDVTENYIIPAEINVRLNGTSIPIVITILNITVFQVAYNYTTAGTYWMNITINGTDVGADPPGFLVIQASEIYPPACYAEGLALSQAVVKKPTSFTVVVKDRYNNHHMWATNPPKVTLAAPGQVSIDGVINTAPDGTYNVTYQANAKATYSMTITLEGTNIQGSPFQVQTNYGNNSTSTIIIVCSVIGGVLVVAAIIGGIVIYRRRQFGYAYLR